MIRAFLSLTRPQKLVAALLFAGTVAGFGSGARAVAHHRRAAWQEYQQYQQWRAERGLPTNGDDDGGGCPHRRQRAE